MKTKLTILAMLLLPLMSWGQVDTAAARILDRYVEMLNITALPKDSMLVLTTTITTTGHSDTVVMERLFIPPQMYRVEVRDSHGLQTALCSNGQDRYRGYSEATGWGDMRPWKFYNHLVGFDFHGPLHNWRAKGYIVKYLGKVTVEQKGAQLDAVHVDVDGHYSRTYLFDPSGLLSLILEDGSNLDPDSPFQEVHIDWKCEHEYSRIGETLLPSLESFLRGGEVTVLRTEMHFEKPDLKRFNQD